MTIQPTGPLPARIMIVGRAPSEGKDALQRAFLRGYSGTELQDARGGEYPAWAMLRHDRRPHPPPGGMIDSFVAQRKSDISRSTGFSGQVLPAAGVLGTQILSGDRLCQPNIIIALGNLAMWALTGKWGITSWRARPSRPTSSSPSTIARRSSLPTPRQW